MNIQELEQGFLIEASRTKIFLGKKNSEVEVLQKLFPEYNLSRIHQVHGNSVVMKDNSNWSDRPEADAQWSTLKSTALCISTADCIPVFIYDARNQRIAAIHAGWRGVAQGITVKTFQVLLNEGTKPEDLQVIIGPHIQKNSFEVDENVKDELKKSVKDFSANWIQTTAENKFLVDLHQLIKSQLQEVGVSADHLSTLFLDTKTDLRFHSYRRDKEKSGRQISFIVQN